MVSTGISLLLGRLHYYYKDSLIRIDIDRLAPCLSVSGHIVIKSDLPYNYSMTRGYQSNL